jgi:toxin CcdB
MAQFDIHRNKGALRESIPFVVAVQSAQFDSYRRRLVVPLVRSSALATNRTTLIERINPVFTIEGISVILHTLDMVSVALDQLGPYVGTLADQGQRITDAIDELLTRSWG